MKEKNQKVLFVLAIMFIGFNLRAALTGVGPLVSMIQSDLHLSSGATGFITTIPLLAFAAMSLLVSKISAKLGEGKTILLSFLIMAAGLLVRSYLGQRACSWARFCGHRHRLRQRASACHH